MKFVVDFETANIAGISLMDVGAAAYAQHPATEVLCLCLRRDYDGAEYLWTPDAPPSRWLEGLAGDPEVIFEAHGAFFEQCIWHYIMVPQYGMPEMPIARWACTMAAALVKGLPGGLEKAAEAANLAEKKDMEGSKLTISLSEPMTKAEHERQMPEDWTGTKAAWKATYEPRFDRSPKTMKRVADYCMQDCRVEDHLGYVVGPLDPYERPVWELDQLINWRGVRIDVPFVTQAMKVVEGARRPLAAEFSRITGGLEPTQVAKLGEWCGHNGLDLDNLAKATLQGLGIGEIEEDNDKARVARQALEARAPLVVRALDIRSWLSSASIRKLPRMMECRSWDDRVRGLLQFYAAHTGRWGGRLFQPQNFPRGMPQINVDRKPPKQAELLAALMTGNAEYVAMLYREPIAAVASALRYALIPEAGHLYAVGDFAGIEARIVLALAGQHDKTALMASGFDVYLDMAEDIYNQPKGSWAVTDKELLDQIKKQFTPQRTIGKNTVLGCGFQMGADTFHDRYCADQSIDFARDVIHAYRFKWAPEVPKLWAALELAALTAVMTDGKAEAYGIIYEVVRNGYHRWLACRLPDGQVMWYYNPMYHPGRPPGTAGHGTWRDKPYWTFRVWKEGQWKLTDAYGGLLTENVVQKIARGLLVAAMYRLEANGFPIVLTVHDEIVAEPLSVLADKKAFLQIMAEPTEYSKVIKVPIAVEGDVIDRYAKV